MILVTDEIDRLRSDDLEQLYEMIRARARYRFPIIGVLDRLRTASDPLNEFTAAKGLVNLAVEVMKDWDKDIGIDGESCLEFEHVTGCDLIGEIAGHLFPYLCIGLRAELPEKLRNLKAAGRWDETKREVLNVLSLAMQDPGIWDWGELARHLITGLQAAKFADHDDLMDWDFAAALQSLGAKAFSEAGESWSLQDIAAWLNEDIASADRPDDITVPEVRRARDRFVTFRDGCKNAGANGNPISSDEALAPVARIGANSSRNSK